MLRFPPLSVLCLLVGLNANPLWAALAERPAADRDRIEHDQGSVPDAHDDPATRTQRSEDNLKRIGRDEPALDTSPPLDPGHDSSPSAGEPFHERIGLDGVREDSILTRAAHAFQGLFGHETTDASAGRPVAADRPTAPQAAPGTAEAGIRTSQSLNKSPNLKPVADFILRSEFAAKPVVDSPEPAKGVNKLRLTNDLKTGMSFLEIVNGDTHTPLFDTRLLDATNRHGRIDSVMVDTTGASIVRYRAYEPDHAYREYRYDARSGLWNGTLLGSLPIGGESIKNFKQASQKPFGDSGQLSVIDYGMNGSMDLVLDENGARKILFSSFDVERSGLTHIRDFAVSPDGQSVAIQTYRAGSLDRFDIRVYNRSTGRLGATVLHTTSTELAWLDNTHVALTHYDAKDDTRTSVQAEIVKGKETTLDGSVEASADGVNLIRQGDKAYTLSVPGTGRNAETLTVDEGALVGRIGRKVFMATGKNEGAYDSIRAIDLDTQTTTDFFSDKQGYLLEGAKRIGGVNSAESDAILVQLGKASTQTRLILDADGKQLGALEIPSCCSLSTIAWKTPGKVLSLAFASAINYAWVDYDLATRTYSKPDFTKDIMTRDGHEYVSEVIETPSADGTMIPVRLTHLKTQANDGMGAALIEVYGGFNRSNPGFAPSFDDMKYRFLADGGTLVSPAVRGGNELGPEWHKAATKTNKGKTYEDVAAAADYLIAQGIAPAKRIIVTGTSNGGLSTAASVLQKPGSFGLAIPVSGVLDLTQAEKLDSEFSGWSYEYGSMSNKDDAANLAKLSPVKSVENWDPNVPMPQFLVVSGGSDSRVNPAHSQNFMTALQAKAPGAGQMVVTKNSGHWTLSPNYEKAIGWHTQSLIWSKIYDFLGWKFQAP